MPRPLPPRGHDRHSSHYNLSLFASVHTFCHTPCPWIRQFCWPSGVSNSQSSDLEHISVSLSLSHSFSPDLSIYTYIYTVDSDLVSLSIVSALSTFIADFTSVTACLGCRHNCGSSIDEPHRSARTRKVSNH